MRNRISFVVLALALSIVPVGCAKASGSPSPAALAPGAANQFDQQTYQILSAAQATINSLKSTVATTPSLKQALNDAITAYDTAEAMAQVYHAQVTAGQNPPTAPVSTALSNMQTSISTLQTAATSGVK